jgi:hypothetical protein
VNDGVVSENSSHAQAARHGLLRVSSAGVAMTDLSSDTDEPIVPCATDTSSSTMP